MPVNEPPLVTVAIPLYRSRPFVRIIRRNLRCLSGSNLEILISDRHLHDNTIDLLEEEFGHDPRIRFMRNTDRIGWVDHFNELFIQARGEFMMWMPHDDDFPEDYVPKLLAALQANPEAVVAFGAIKPIDRFGIPLDESRIIDPGPLLASGWNRRLHLRIMTHSAPGAAFRGLFRRRLLLDRGLLISPTRRSVLADHYWTFATGFIGSWVYVPDCWCKKRFYSGSTHPRWRYSTRQWWNGLAVLNGYARDHTLGRRDRIHSRVTLLLWIVANMLNTSTRKGSAPAPVANLLQPMVHKLIDALVKNPAETHPPVMLLYWGEEAAQSAPEGG